MQAGTNRSARMTNQEQDSSTVARPRQKVEVGIQYVRADLLQSRVEEVCA